MPFDSDTPRDNSRFAFGLTTADVVELQTILREDCGEDVPLEESWSRAAGLLAVTQLLLDHGEPADAAGNAPELEHRPT